MFLLCHENCYSISAWATDLGSMISINEPVARSAFISPISRRAPQQGRGQLAGQRDIDAASLEGTDRIDHSYRAVCRGPADLRGLGVS